MSLKRARSPQLESKGSGETPKIYRSAPIEDRSSIFTAFYSPTLPLSALQTHPYFESASHRIAAWRKPSKQRTVLPGAPPLYDTGFEDDGESYAGKKVERVMEDEKVVGAIVVGRWYGGVLLGPVRFKHIEDCAKNAVQKWREDTGEPDAEKKRKIDGEEAEQKKLARELEKRDQNIIVLRQLLQEKQAASGATPSQSIPSSSSSVKVMDYTVIPLARLKQLEKGRDATISWLLKKIDQVEQAQTVAEKPESAIKEDAKDQTT